MTSGGMDKRRRGTRSRNSRAQNTEGRRFAQCCAKNAQRKAGIQCWGMDIRRRVRYVDVRNGREMVAGLNRKREDPTSP